jgi:hypothetical protein
MSLNGAFSPAYASTAACLEDFEREIEPVLRDRRNNRRARGQLHFPALALATAKLCQSLERWRRVSDQ